MSEPCHSTVSIIHLQIKDVVDDDIKKIEARGVGLDALKKKSGNDVIQYPMDITKLIVYITKLIVYMQAHVMFVSQVIYWELKVLQ